VLEAGCFAWLLKVSRFMLPLITASACSALSLRSSSSHLLVQNHISSGVAFSMDSRRSGEISRKLPFFL